MINGAIVIAHSFNSEVGSGSAVDCLFGVLWMSARMSPTETIEKEGRRWEVVE